MWNPFKKKGEEVKREETPRTSQKESCGEGEIHFYHKESYQAERNAREEEAIKKKAMAYQKMKEDYGHASYLGYTTGRWDKAERIFVDLMKTGLPEANVALAQLAQATDKTLAAKYYKSIANTSAEGAWGYAANLGHGYIADKDGEDKEWYHYCLLAALRGCPDAMNELGNMYNRKDHYLGALYWYYMCAFYEHHQGWNGVIGVMQKWMENGTPALEDEIDGVSKSETSSVKYAVEAVRDKNLDIAHLMHWAMMDNNEFAGLFIGHMCEQMNDWVHAKMGFQVAAHNRKSIMSKKCLGDMLAYGKGCQRDIANAFDWYKAAAEMGEKSAQFIYGQFVAQKNPAEGVYWLACAYRRGYEPAREFIIKNVKL